MKRRLWRAAIAFAFSIGLVSVTSVTPAFAVNNFVLFPVTEPPGGHNNFPCIHGDSYTNVPIDLISANNNCDVRVWMYQFAGGGGYNICISPKAQNFQFHRSYGRIFISLNSSHC
jgi:hypothetical protein